MAHTLCQVHAALGSEVIIDAHVAQMTENEALTLLEKFYKDVNEVKEHAK